MFQILRITLFCLFSAFCSLPLAAQQLVTYEFAEELNGHVAEARFYYQKNWQKLREQALGKGYIAEYKLVEVEGSEDQPAGFMLLTVYANAQQFAKREEHFRSLIDAAGGLALLNQHKPGSFRKVTFSIDKGLNLTSE